MATVPKIEPEPDVIEVTVVCALPHDTRAVNLRVPAATCARDAVRLAVVAGLDLDGTGIDARAPIGIHGRRVEDATCLLDQDRVELYRPLRQDPMQRRRERADSERAAARGEGRGV